MVLVGDLLWYYIGSLLWICAALDARFESMNFKYMMREYLIWITERTPLIGTEFYELKTRLARLKVYMEFQIVLRADQTILTFVFLDLPVLKGNLLIDLINFNFSKYVQICVGQVNCTSISKIQQRLCL